MFSKYAFLFFVIILGTFTFILSEHPAHNGDMPFYIVCAIQMEQGVADSAVEKAKLCLKQDLTPEEYTEHAGRIERATPEYFDFYRIKPLYVMMVLLFHKIGFSYVRATVIPSLLCFFLIGITIWRFSIQYLETTKTFLVSTLCMMIYPSLILARLSTPDAMSCFFLLNALFFIYSGRQMLIWFSLLLLALCTRLDNIVAELVLLFSLVIWPGKKDAAKGRIKDFALLAMILGAVAVSINFLFTKHLLHVSDPFAERSTGGYINNIKWYLLSLPGSFLIMLIILFVFTRSVDGFSWKNKVNYMIYVLLTIVWVRFLLYPFYEERFFTPFILFGMLIISYQSSEAKMIKT